MIGVAIWLFFLVGTAINIAWLARLDLARIDFLDGVLIGQAYYVIIPLFAFLVRGQAEMADVMLVYRPYQDLATTGMLITGLFLFPTLRVLFPPVPRVRPDRSDARMVPAILILFALTGLLAFVLSGLGGGGHWQGNLESAFENPAFLPIKYAANVARNAVFAVLLYWGTRGQGKASRAIAIGVAVALIDVFTTFNRVAAVYLVIMALLLAKHRPWRMLLGGGLSLWGLSLLSTLWPAFRGLATLGGYSPQAMAQAWAAARRAQEVAPVKLDDTLNAVFESSNIVVLNWIVEHYGTLERPLLTFAMFARPVTLLLPGSVWSGRPQNFGLSLGDGIAGLPSLALNSTLYGESYANFGPLWPLGLSAFVLLWHGVYRLIAPNAQVVQAMGAFAAIAMWRFDASFVGCAALVTGAMVCALRLLRLTRFKPVRPFYFAQPARQAR
jgi:hypothetical protein